MKSLLFYCRGPTPIHSNAEPKELMHLVLFIPSLLCILSYDHIRYHIYLFICRLSIPNLHMEVHLQVPQAVLKGCYHIL